MKNNLKSKNLQKLIDLLEGILPIAEKRDDHLDMGEMRVRNKNGYQCGTIHCFAGWVQVAIMQKEKKINDGFSYDYHSGRRNINKILELSSFESWAEKNPKLWGNYLGSHLFVHKISFRSKKRPFGANNLRDIIDHLKEVKARLVKI